MCFYLFGDSFWGPLGDPKWFKTGSNKNKNGTKFGTACAASQGSACWPFQLFARLSERCQVAGNIPSKRKGGIEDLEYLAGQCEFVSFWVAIDVSTNTLQ